MRTFISGGCKNGKSTYAESLAKMRSFADRPLYYIATMSPFDKEDQARITRHQAERAGMGFITVEQSTCIEQILEVCDTEASFLLDSLTALLMNELFMPITYEIDVNATTRIKRGLDKIFETVSDIVFVSDYIYSDAIAYVSETTEVYRKALAELDRYVAQKCDVVIEVAYTHKIIHKGKEYLHEIS